jgi:hypothetical protein
MQPEKFEFFPLHLSACIRWILNIFGNMLGLAEQSEYEKCMLKVPNIPSHIVGALDHNTRTREYSNPQMLLSASPTMVE